ncbi:MAG TPA: flagellar basal body-associated FliL family protein [Steroidobacteraceae bacterium]|jgi:flagellar FliL protein|nr:flagellar basal body-associated FliL family protein [Steroidobacteraceae bacterium]
MAAEIPVVQAADKTASAKPSGKRKLLFIIVGSVAVVLLAAAVGAAWWLSSSGHKAAAPAEAAKAAPAPAGPPLFLALDPPFVVNFDGEQAVRFLQITVQLMSRDQATIDMLKTNDPIVRNDLLLLFGNQKYAQLATREGKEGLRDQALADVRKVLESAGGHPERVEAVYFTSFVMQ